MSGRKGYLCYSTFLFDFFERFFYLSLGKERKKERKSKKQADDESSSPPPFPPDLLRINSTYHALEYDTLLKCLSGDGKSGALGNRAAT